MKKAIGKYVLVRAITRDQAIKLARELFADGPEGNKLWAEGDKLWAEGDKLWAEGNKLRTEGNKLRAEGDKLWAEGDKLWAEGDKLRAEGDKLWAELAISQMGYLPEWRAMNLIAADMDRSVYCFVFTRRELWVYDGEICPDPDTVEKIELGI